jgi:hypothetical protein
MVDTLGNEVFSDAIQEMCTQSGLSMNGDVQYKFRKWLSLPAQRQYPTSREGIRFGAAAYFGNGRSFLDSKELAWLENRRVVNQMSSDQVKANVGFSNNFDPANRGFSVRRS